MTEAALEEPWDTVQGWGTPRGPAHTPVRFLFALPGELFPLPPKPGARLLSRVRLSRVTASQGRCPPGDSPPSRSPSPTQRSQRRFRFCRGTIARSKQSTHCCTHVVAVVFPAGARTSGSGAPSKPGPRSAPRADGRVWHTVGTRPTSGQENEPARLTLSRTGARALHATSGQRLRSPRPVPPVTPRCRLHPEARTPVTCSSV